MEQLRAAQRRQATRARNQQNSSDQRSRRLASYGHHGAGRVGRCAAAQGISAVREASLRAASRHGRLRARFAELLCCSVEYRTAGSNMNPSAGYRWLNLALSLTALFATILHAVASDRRVMCAALYHEL